MILDRFSLAGRTACVVGGSRGIGAAIAQAFAEVGANVAIVGRSAEALEQASARLGAHPVKVLTVQADVADPAQRATVLPRVVEGLGGVDILVNCAGAKPLRGDMTDREHNPLPALFELNVNAYLELSVGAARLMKKAGWGRIINVSSSTALKARSGMGEYSVTKAAEIMLTRSLAVELGEFGVTVNALAPILTRTEFSAAQLADDSDVERVLAMQAIKRIAEPEDIAGAALLLASEAGAFITGATIVIDGGAHA